MVRSELSFLIVLLIVICYIIFSLRYTLNKYEAVKLPIPVISYEDGSMTEATSAMPLAPHQHYVSNITWNVYGGNKVLQFQSQISNKNIVSLQNEQTKKLLDNVSLDFQKNMLLATPLSCYPDKEGFFPKKYEKFLIVLDEYAKRYRTMTSDTRTLVWQCPGNQLCGGFADRLKGITFSLLLAIFSNRRLILDWESSAESVHLHPNMIKWTDHYLHDLLNGKPAGNNKTIPHMVKVSVMEGGRYPYVGMSVKDWQKHLTTIAGNERLFVMITNIEVSLVSKLSQTNQKWLSDGFKLAGLSQLSNHELDDILGIVFRYLFKLDNVIIQEFSRAKQALQLTNQSYVGLHLRTGFSGVKTAHDTWAGHPKILKGRQRWKAALRCAVTTADKFLGKKSLVFLAADSNVVKEMAINTFGGRFRTLNNYLVHLDTMNRRVKPGKHEKEGAIFALVDILLLAESYAQVRGASGYSWVAGLLCGPLPNEHLIDSVTCKTDDLNVIHI